MFSFRNILPAVRTLFGIKSTETFMENGIEARWDENYRSTDKINFAEIFANRLSKYTFAGSSITADDEAVNNALSRCMLKSRKWCQAAIGTGRAFLVPYVVGNTVYTDIITQGKTIVSKVIGDDIHGVVVLADIRNTDKRWYLRWTKYEFDADAGTFTVENKATALGGVGEVALNVVPEWADIDPLVTINGVDRPLFAYVDSPKDNRTTDKLQGAPITFGCEKTIAEIYECLEQYRTEYKLKKTFLGVDKMMLDKDGKPINDLYQTFEGKDTESLFEIFSPDIRDASYRGRLLDLFARLEKEVGTSNGILTPSDTSMATATQVRRAMFDTFAMVNDIRSSVANAIDTLCYAYGIYFKLLGIPFSQNYTVSYLWGDEFVKDSAESFSQKLQAEAIGAVSKAEVRAELYPNETPKEAEAAIEKIEESRPEPMVPDFFGE